MINITYHCIKNKNITVESLEKAKLALRKHLLENKDSVLADLEMMRKNSSYIDTYGYVENISKAFSFNIVKKIA